MFREKKTNTDTHKKNRKQYEQQGIIIEKSVDQKDKQEKNINRQPFVVNFNNKAMYYFSLNPSWNSMMMIQTKLITY